MGYSAATAALLSVLVEFAQMFNFRVPDVDDVILNTAGGFAGYLLFAACNALRRRLFGVIREGR